MTRNTWLVTSILLLSTLLLPVPAGAEETLLTDDDAGSGGDAPFFPGLDTVPGTYDGRVTRETDRDDWYRIHSDTEQLLTITVDHMAKGVEASLFGMAVGPLRAGESRAVAVPANETHYLRFGIASALGTGDPDHLALEIAIRGTYRFSVSFAPLPASDDAGSGQDAGGDGDAVHLDTGTHAASMGDWDLVDTYEVAVPGGTTVDILVDAPFQGLLVELYDESPWHGLRARTVEDGYALTWSAADDTVLTLALDLRSFHADADTIHDAYTIVLSSGPGKGLPSLAITDASLTRHAPADVAVAGFADSWTVTVNVTNQGAGTALDIPVLFTYFRKTGAPALGGVGGTEAQSVTIDTLAPGEHATVTVTFDGDLAASARFSAEVDPLGQLQDQDRGDQRVVWSSWLGP